MAVTRPRASARGVISGEDTPMTVNVQTVAAQGANTRAAGAKNVASFGIAISRLACAKDAGVSDRIPRPPGGETNCGWALGTCHPLGPRRG